MGVLTADMKRVVEQQQLGFVATVSPDGSPNLSPKGTTAVWDDDHLIFADICSPATIANLRAEWAKLDAPLRLQGLAERHLALKPLVATQYDSLKNLPERPPNFAKPGSRDPIGAMIETIDAAVDPETVTGSVPAPEEQR